MEAPEAAGFAYVWEFVVRAERVADFEAAYGPAGGWVQLFRRGAGYRRTDLLRDLADPLRYVTIDWWRSRQDCARFREQHAGDLAALDRACEELTTREAHLGDIEVP